MKKHVIQFEVEVPDATPKKMVEDTIKELLDLLEFNSKNLQIDPPPDIKIIREPSPQAEKPFRPYPPSTPYVPSPSPDIPPRPWSSNDDIYWLKESRDGLNEMKTRLEEAKQKLKASRLTNL